MNGIPRLQKDSVVHSDMASRRPETEGEGAGKPLAIPKPTGIVAGFDSALAVSRSALVCIQLIVHGRPH
ncbi:MAG TPA: hypothetical protein PKM73_06455 [Verrucomicrobiota bacterium]|nr:hypothetical protein [Verrucomicrobiota bacterium]